MRLTKISSAALHPYPAAILTHQFGNTDHYHTDTAYAFVTHEAPSGALDAGESEDIKAFTADQLAALPQGEIPENVREVGLFVLTECLKEWVEVNTAEFQTNTP